MTQEEIIRMAREAGSIDSEDVIETVWAAFAAAEQAEQEPVIGAYEVVNEKGDEWSLVYPAAVHRYKSIPEERITQTFYAAPVEPVKQEPETETIGMILGGELVALVEEYKTGAWPIYAAPVRTKDLTDDEIEEVCARLWSGGWRKKAMNDFARAVIAADRELNR